MTTSVIKNAQGAPWWPVVRTPSFHCQGPGLIQPGKKELKEGCTGTGAD